MRRFSVVSLVVIVSALAFCGPRAGAARAATSPIGAHSMLQVNAPLAFKQRMFAEAAAMHVSAIRLDVQPSIVFPSPLLPPDFRGLDEVMALSQQYHLRVVADLLSLPWWLAACQQSGVDVRRCGTNDLLGYRMAISQIVTHADPVIRDWEIWNEPDSPSFFSGTPQQYALMLRTAHDAIKGIDPQANVVLGGISGTWGMSWMAQVLATPGADAIHAFDVANVHERGRLDALGPDIAAWKKFLVGHWFWGPLWVTEHGYPSDPAFQSDPAYGGGANSQAAFLTASIPTLLDAGAGQVFVTERDNLGGQFASEGVLGGTVLDPPVSAPAVIEKPSYGTVALLSACYAALGRDCPGPGAAATPSSLTTAPAVVSSSSTASVTISNPGSEPLQIGTLSLGATEPFALSGDSCSAQMLEPGKTCTATVTFAPQAAGAARTTLQVPSDNGTLEVGVNGFAPSVASLTWSRPAFESTGAFNHAGQVQRLVVELRNPLSSAEVPVAGSALSRRNGFTIGSDGCRHVRLDPGATCRIAVVFRPTGSPSARATLILRGGGESLRIALRAGPIAPPTVRAVAARTCLAVGSRVAVVTDEPALVRWRVVRWTSTVARACRPQGDLRGVVSRGGGRSSASGRVLATAATVLTRGTGRSVARFGLPSGLGPGTYVLSVAASNAHGTGETHVAVVTVLP